MPSPLFEAYYIGFPRPDARQGSGYGALKPKGKSSPSVGTPLQKQSLYPYVSPEESEFYQKHDDEEDEVISAKDLVKLYSKLGGPVHVNDPFASNWVDRGAFVNWATRLDLYENRYTSINDIDFAIDPPYSLGGPSQIIAMGNGAGIYKTKSGKTIGMSSAGRPQSVSAVKTDKKIPASLTDFIKKYLQNDEEEI